jgi:hypothetical protein
VYEVLSLRLYLVTGLYHNVWPTVLSGTFCSNPERVLQDGLYYEFTRYCPTAVVRMYGEGKGASAVVKFDS